MWSLLSTSPFSFPGRKKKKKQQNNIDLRIQNKSLKKVCAVGEFLVCSLCSYEPSRSIYDDICVLGAIKVMRGTSKAREWNQEEQTR